MELPMTATIHTGHSATDQTRFIKPRDRSHEIADALATDWLDNNAFLTAFFNTMSITFPVGEKFFIDSVRHYRGDIIDPALLQNIKGFCGQEGFHRREHQRYNEQLCAARGYDLEILEGAMTRRLRWAQKKLPPLTNLGVTVAIEHLTAVLSEQLLGNDSVMDKADPAMRELWRWHAAEEMEHKAVAFDVFLAVGGSDKLRKSCLRRASFFLIFELLRGLTYMLKADGHLFSVSQWRQGLKALFGKSGVFAGAWESYREFYQDGFHPWQQDTHAMLEKWESETLPA
jgi:predicted metal-dependent hydrolase